MEVFQLRAWGFQILGASLSFAPLSGPLEVIVVGSRSTFLPSGQAQHFHAYRPSPPELWKHQSLQQSSTKFELFASHIVFHSLGWGALGTERSWNTNVMNYDWGIDALATACSWNTGVIRVWAWVLWSPYAFSTRTLFSWFYMDATDIRMFWACMLWKPNARRANDSDGPENQGSPLQSSQYQGSYYAVVQFGVSLPYLSNIFYLQILRCAS